MQSFARRILKSALSHGASAAQVSISTARGLNTSVRLGEVDVIEYSREQGFSVTVYIDQQSGTAACSEISEAAVERTVAKAVDIARFTQSDPYCALADKELLAYNYSDLDLYHPWRLSQEAAIDLAKRCEYIGLNRYKAINNSEGVSISSQDCHYIYANTHDFMGSYKTTLHNMSAVFIAQAADEMQRDYDYTSARDLKDLVDIETLANSAAERTVQRLGARKIKTAKLPIVFAASVAKSLLKHFIAAVSGSNLYRKTSFLVDCLNKPIFPHHVTLTERPHLPKALGSSPFDSEGVATSEKTIVADGRLKTYLLGSYSARKLNMQSTGNADGVHNLFINTVDGDLKELLRQMGKGLLVTELIGQGVNLITGDYSRGAFGYWIENGEIQYPVCEVTIAGNLRDIFANLVAVANDVDHRGKIHTGSILVDAMVVAGQ